MKKDQPNANSTRIFQSHHQLYCHNFQNLWSTTVIYTSLIPIEPLLLQSISIIRSSASPVSKFLQVIIIHYVLLLISFTPAHAPESSPSILHLTLNLLNTHGMYLKIKKQLIGDNYHICRLLYTELCPSQVHLLKSNFSLLNDVFRDRIFKGVIKVK